MRRYDVLIATSIAALAGAAWLALWAMPAPDQTAMPHHHHHGAMAAGSPMLTALAVSVGGWTVMTIAMMLPTIVPLLTTFAAVARDRRDRLLLIALVVAGYLLTWAVCGAAVFAGQQMLKGVAVSGAGVLLLAGVYQFTPLKQACLEKCRSPLSFVIARWQGRRHQWQALRLGIDHGVFCVGCCWALMLLMLAAGMANLAWMLGLAIVMAIEKNVRWGRRLTAPIGIILLVSAASLLWR